MKNIFLLFLFFHCFFNSFSQIEQLKKNDEQLKKHLQSEFNKNKEIFKSIDLSLNVNPFIGTGGHGHTFPGAVAPFGMIQLSPDSRHQGWDACSGYHYSDSTIFGFSHTHLSGTGVEDLCDLLLVPQTTKVNPYPKYKNENGYISYFSHNDEKASPGYYEVKLRNPNVKVRLTVTQRAGLHEYNFIDSNVSKIILIDLEHKDEILSSEIKIINKNEIQGKRISKAWAKNQHFYFYLQCNEQFKTKFYGNNKLALIFPKNVQKVLIKVGISAVDELGAKNNLVNEIPDFDFEKIKNNTKNLWNKELHKIDIKTSNQKNKTIFYTALYHSFLTPIIFSDVDGKYRGNDDKIYQDKSSKRYSIFSIWDTYRSTHPLYNIIQTSRSADFIQTLLNIYNETNDLPVWELWGNETECMIGYHSTSLILDAYKKNIPINDKKLALDAMLKTSKDDNFGKKYFRKYGFIDSSVEPESVSKALEYSYDDWCISEFAKECKNYDIFKEYKFSSYNFINHFNLKSKFMQPRKATIWTPNFRPSEVNFNFTEANSWQYSLYAPHAIDAHVKLLGGKDSLESFLDRLFSANKTLEGRQQSDITGLIGQYAHGNEPSHHVAYLYNYTNNPSKTQEKIDEILKEMYHNTPDGLSGNEDCGQMSSWYVFSSIGFYPVCPGSTTYSFGRPIFENAIINLENGNKFKIIANNVSDENRYIQSITLNGKDYKYLYIEHDSIMNGGELIFNMSNKKNINLKEWHNNNFYDSYFDSIIPQASLDVNKNMFFDSIRTKIDILPLEFLGVKYSINGDTTNLIEYKNGESILIDSKSNFTLKSYRNNKASSLEKISTTFFPLDSNVELILESKYANSYIASGKDALIDKEKGGLDFRSGPWQGYEENNCKGKITYKNSINAEKIVFRCLQDERSWIFLPKEILVEIEYEDGNNEKLILKNEESPYKKGSFVKEFFVTVKNTKIKNIKFELINISRCPKGHLGEGEKAWLFIDEIEVL